uniref:Ras and EF-hand domain-containing protein n=1 Tax=Mesocestoides corti TaxID=53468 RepID=A0A5K3EJG5_MESCO
MAAQTKNDLAAFLRSYDTDGSGSFDRDRWLHLCTSAKINLPQESAADLFDRLDTDRNGIVTIAELLDSLSEWQKSLGESGAEALGGIETGMPVDVERFAGPSSTSFRNMKDKRMDSLYESSPNELDVDFGKSVEEATRLSKMISDSYPELAASFRHLLETFKKDIAIKKNEHADLEESYQREKLARKQDLQRLEKELDSQIQMVEERLRTEISKKYEAEYTEKVRRKELETQRFRETVNELTQQVQSNKRKRSSITNVRSANKLAPTEDGVFAFGGFKNRIGNGHPQSAEDLKAQEASAESALLKEAMELRKKLMEAQQHLRESEAELTQLRATVETQSSQLYMEKLRASTFIEEKDLLYDQIQKLRDALREVQGMHAAFHPEECLERAPDLQGQSWRRDSGQWSGSNEYSDRHFANADPEVASTTNWSNLDSYHAPDRIFRVVMVGDSSVGKTCFMYRFCTGDFYYNARATVGIDFKTKNMMIDGNVYTIEIWDTAGQEKFHSLARQYFRKCDGAILMYDVSSRESFLGVRDWISMLEENCGETFLPRVVVGNKIDLRDGPENSIKPPATAFITTQQGKDLAKVYKAEFVETSVLNYVNVDQVIVDLARAMKYRGDCQSSGIRISKKSPKKRLTECCT